MKRFICALLLLLGLAAITSAATYTIGYVDQNGYTFLDDGYWHRGTSSYTREATYHAGYWSGCNYVQPWYTYAYTLYTAPAYVAPKLPSYTDPGWRGKLLDIAAARDRAEAEIRKGAFEHQQYMEAVNGLGLAGNFRWNGYGAYPPYPLTLNGSGYGAGYQVDGSITSGAVNANTQYGYSYNSIASVYGDNNQAALMQQFAQIVQQAQALGGQANSNFSGLLAQDGSNRARVAEIIANGQMAQQIILALKTGPASENKQFTFKVTNGQVLRDDTTVTPETRTKLSADFQALASTKCAQCHSGASPAGKFNIDSYPTLSPEQKQAVWTRLVTPDDTKVMPRVKGGGPGQRLTSEEFRAFVLN